ncbi:MAG: HIT domain-containing protein [Pseudomonadota bacterium]
MERLFAPWRIEYVLGKDKESGCIFCTKPASDADEQNLLVHRGRGAFTMMNKYPYNNGHLLVSPYRHVSDICELTLEEMGLVTLEVTRAVTVLRTVMKAEGFNVGLNLGEIAGAGIEEHLHYHVVPRWRGDTNVMAVLAELRVIPEHFTSTWRNLRKAFQELYTDE